LRVLESNTARNHAKGKGYDSLAWRATQGKAPTPIEPGQGSVGKGVRSLHGIAL